MCDDISCRSNTNPRLGTPFLVPTIALSILRATDEDTVPLVGMVRPDLGVPGTLPVIEIAQTRRRTDMNEKAQTLAKWWSRFFAY
jgi:hypothetical protein